MTVNNVNALLSYQTSQNVGQTDQNGLKPDEIGNRFDQVMSKMNDTIKSLHAAQAGNTAAASQTVESADLSKSPAKDMPVQNSDQKPADNSGKAENAMQQKGNDKVVKDADAETDQSVEEVEEAAKKLVQDIADEMDVTPEEVEEAMAVLGLTAVELFDVDKLKQLLLQISGSTDELSLVTDAALYDNLQNLFAAVEETLGTLQEELGLTEEELNALMEQMISEGKESDVTDAGLVQDMPEVNLEGMKDYTVSVQKDGETVQVKVSVDDASGSKSVQEEVTNTPKVEVTGSHKMREKNDSADNGRGEGSASGNAFLQAFDKPMEVSETPEPVNAGYQSVQTEEIMNQIMEYMKINLKADTQVMELQLHPASLGTVGVQIAAKDGVITAQFTTQNESVRAVIETQLIQLKNQFEEQGIKVDAVEVTVANHEYGQQFSQDHENSGQQQSKSAKGVRRINLDEIDEETELEEMEESDRIAVEMMQASGNTVDYTA